MDVHLHGYRFERQLRSSTSSEVWAGVREQDQLPVIAKLFAIEDRSDGIQARLSNQARVDHEFEMIRRLELPGVIRALALERAGEHLILVLEAHRGVDLAEFVRRAPLSTERFLSIAVQIARILAEVHEQRVIHRDIKPTNILIDPESGEVVLADFGISQLLESERGRIHDRDIIEGTLPYMAPEQTGRTAREVDFRSDLYSLGVTFYEALTGQRPFTAESPLELIHAHLARKPKPPQRLRPELPTALSELIMKLLEKAPERRYQSARGLWRDLVKLQQILPAHELGEFELGRDDAPLTLQLPHQLYGRERERVELQAAFRRAVEGKPELVVVLGAAGVGKSALVAELDEPVLGHRGFLIRGRFAAGSDQPLIGIVAALSSLADQLLTEPPERLDRWREQLRAVLGSLAAVLVDLVPAFRRVLDERPATGSRMPNEVRNQVMLATVRLLREFARPEHPLVLVLDDIQWADPATFDLLENLLGEAQAALLVVLAGQESALQTGGPLPALLTRQQAREASVTRLELGALEREPLVQLIADVLSQPPARVEPLAEIVARKTGSNPFFIGQMLLHLAERGLLRRDSGGWTWDLGALEVTALPDDVLDMMTQKLGGLDGELRWLLQIASVIGGQFDPHLLARVAELPHAEGRLLDAFDEGLIAPSGNDYVFGHERIREAAYVSLDPVEQARLHLAIGRQLLAGLDDASRDPRVFEVVEHLDRGHRLTDEGGPSAELGEQELLELARLNLRAGQRSLASGAPRSAAVYLRVARRVLDRLGEFPDPSDPLHTLYFATELASAQVETLTKQYDEADARLVRLLGRGLGVEQHGLAASNRCWALTFGGKPEAAVRFGLATLREFGIAIPSWPTLRHVVMAMPRMTRMIRPESLARLRTLEPVREPRILAALDIFVALATTSYVVSPMAFVVMVANHASLILRHGNHPSAPLVFSQLGIVLANAFGWQRQALEVAKLCNELSEGSSLRHRVLQSDAFIRLWSEPYLPLLDQLDEIIEGAFEQGDITSAEVGWANFISYALYGGRHLRLLEASVESRIRWMETWGTTGLAGGGPEVIEACRMLIEGPGPEPGNLDPLGVLAKLDGKASIQFYLLADYTVLSALVLGVHGRWAEVFTLLDPMIAPIDRSLPRTWYIAISRTLRGIGAAVLAREATSGSRRRKLLALLTKDAKLAERWTAQAGNFAHVAALLRGELAALRGDLDEATRRFEQARTLAGEQHNPIYEALASERLAAALLAHGHERPALGPLLDARDRYQYWGAFAKVSALEQQWPELTKRSGTNNRPIERTSSSSSNSTTSRAIDSATLLKASQTLADDIRLEEVVDRVMSIALENAGAQRGVLVLADEGKLSLAAESSAEAGTLTHLDNLIPLGRAAQKVAASVLHWVERTGEAVVLADAGEDHRFQADPYLRAGGGFSILCLPFVKRGRLVGLLYLENRLSAGSFVPERLEMLRLLTAQAASALENARLYADLRSSEIRWRSLVEQLPDHVILVDRNGELEYVNVFTHTRRPTNLHFGADDLLSNQYRDMADVAIKRVFEHGAREQFEVEATPANGDARWYSVRVAPIVVDGRIERAILVATDISDRKRAERQREHFEGQLRQQQRLESIGTLASGVAHEINNPVQGIMNYAELIAGSEAANDDIREFAGEIEIETRRVTTIVRNLLAFSRQELSEASEAVALAEIVNGTLSLVRAVMRKDQIALDIDVPADLPRVRCRSQQIQQVIMNLVTNARDALNNQWPGYNEHKRIRITASAFEQDGATWVRLSVEDRGGGVPEDVVGRIFDPFFTTKGRDKGTGLGLSVSHGIVTEHGGRLVLDNQPEVGARFSIELPA
jgi:predicted ATPase/signal transduction histidine kinase/tRNA A-37 threonylcarbamoyl transferase component Bud32